MKKSIQLKETFPVKPEQIYNAWLNSEQHSSMTGGKAVCSDEINADFSAWDGYISGKNIELSANEKIIQSWRTSEFNDEDDDSVLEIYLTSADGGCEITLVHSQIPDGQPDYEQGWRDHYFAPMKDCFSD